MNDALKPEDTRDALRKIGVVLFGIGALMLFIRKGTIPGDRWGDFPLFLVLALPAVTFYYLGVGTTAATGGLRSWQSVSAVLGLIFVPLALLQFIQLIGGSGSNLNTFWIFGLTAALAAYAGIVVGVRFGLCSRRSRRSSPGRRCGTGSSATLESAATSASTAACSGSSRSCWW